MDRTEPGDFPFAAAFTGDAGFSLSNSAGCSFFHVSWPCMPGSATGRLLKVLMNPRMWSRVSESFLTDSHRGFALKSSQCFGRFVEELHVCKPILCPVHPH